MTRSSNSEQTFASRSNQANNAISPGKRAAQMARRIISIRRTDLGLEDAMHSLAKEIGVSIWTVKDWWKQQDKGVLATTFDRLRFAYRAEVARQAKAYLAELDDLEGQSKDAADQILVRAAALVAGATDTSRGGINEIDIADCAER